MITGVRLIFDFHKQRGAKAEKEVSCQQQAEKTHLPVLVDQQLLRRRGAGQCDSAFIDSEGLLWVVEIKAEQQAWRLPRNGRQVQRLQQAANFLGQIFTNNTNFRLFYRK